MTDNIDMKKVKLHEMLKEKLEGENISKVARETGIPKQRLHDWYAAKKNPRFKYANELKVLANYLGLTFDELVFGEVKESRVLSSVKFEDAEGFMKFK